MMPFTTYISQFHPDWINIISELRTDNFLHFWNTILRETAFSPREKAVFYLFKRPLSEIKVVMLGDNPPLKYSNGLFVGSTDNHFRSELLDTIRDQQILSLPENEIYKGDDWTTLKHLDCQGVFLLNKSLTCSVGSSHYEYWQRFTNKVISEIAKNNPCIWILNANSNEQYRLICRNEFIDANSYSRDNIEYIPISNYANYILVSENNKYDNDVFYKANSLLKQLGNKKINW